MSETKDWRRICADCQEGKPPKDCEYYGEPRGCNAPTYGGPHPKYFEGLREDNAHLRAALKPVLKCAEGYAHGCEEVADLRRRLKAAEDARPVPASPNICDKANLVIREFEKVATRRPDGLTVIDCECSRLECAVEELKEALGETSC